LSLKTNEPKIYKQKTTTINMKKIITKYGNSYVIKLTKEDREIIGLDEGDLLDIEIRKIERKTTGDENE